MSLSELELEPELELELASLSTSSRQKSRRLAMAALGSGFDIAPRASCESTSVFPYTNWSSASAGDPGDRLRIAVFSGSLGGVRPRTVPLGELGVTPRCAL